MFFWKKKKHFFEMMSALVLSIVLTSFLPSAYLDIGLPSIKTNGGSNNNGMFLFISCEYIISEMDILNPIDSFSLLYDILFICFVKFAINFHFVHFVHFWEKGINKKCMRPMSQNEMLLLFCFFFFYCEALPGVFDDNFHIFSYFDFFV